MKTLAAGTETDLIVFLQNCAGNPRIIEFVRIYGDIF